MRRRSFLLLVALVAAPAWCAVGDPDPSFDGDGIRLIALDRGGSNQEGARAVLALDDGRILLVGDSRDGASAAYDADAVLSMLLPNGATDTSFGSGGTVVVPFDGAEATSDRAYAVARDPAGRFVLAGESGTDELGYSMVVARTTAAGALDTSFSIDGKASVSFGPGTQGGAYGMAVQPDGRIVLGGIAVDATGRYAAGVARLTTSGAADTSFAGDGTAMHYIGSGLITFAQAMLLQPDGRILVAGATDTSTLTDNYDMFVARLREDGSLDPAFGTGGVQTIGFDQVANGTDVAYALALRPDGRILLAGAAAAAGGGTGFAAAQLLPDGTPDASFGTLGLAMVDPEIIPAGEDTARAVVVGLDGRAWLVGTVQADTNFGDDIGIVRLLPDGTPDAGFGAAGTAIHALDRGDPGVTSDDWGRAATLDANGRLVLAGFSASGTTSYTTDMLVMRFTGASVFSDGFEPTP